MKSTHPFGNTDYHDIRCNVLNAIQQIQINALNDRIKRLEEDLMDANNKHAALVADVALYEDRGERIKRLEEAGDEMYRWITVKRLCSIDCTEAWNKAKEAKP